MVLYLPIPHEILRKSRKVATVNKKPTDVEDLSPEPLATTPSFAVWRDVDDAGETVYHLELGMFTAHFFEEDWKELVSLFDAVRAKSAGMGPN